MKALIEVSSCKDMETEESSIYPPFPSFLKAVKRFCRT